MKALLKSGRRAAAEVKLTAPSAEAASAVETALRFFDEEWYKSQYSSILAKSNLSPREHYAKIGYLENHSPSPFFDAEFYVESSPDVAKAGIPAIVHYLTYGGREWRKPSPLLNMDRYFELYRNEVEASETHTVLEDMMSSEDRSAAFAFLDLAYYEPTGDHAETPNARLRDFICFGLDAGRNPHILIELQRLNLKGSAYEKYRTFSRLFTAHPAIQKTKTHPLTDPEFYQKKHGNTENHPIVHYLDNWVRGDRWIHPLFDSGFYMSAVQNVDDRIDPLSHFVLKGDDAGVWPNAYFDCAFYRKEYKKDLEGGVHPLNHYMINGHLHWFEPSERFGQRFYLSNHPELTEQRQPALVNFLHFGQENGRLPIPPRPFFDQTAGLEPEDIVALIKRAAITATTSPRVSVIVPVYKNLTYTLRCVLSMLESNDQTPFEIMIADDHSPDDSGRFLADQLGGLAGITVYSNEENLGFLLSCNAAAERAKTEFVYFLNNDTAVLPGWLDELVESFERDTQVGLAGSKLLYPNGLLQEAGGIVWDKGVCANFGRLCDPGRPEFNYQRDVDYISGASIMMRRDLWQEVGGFSTAFAPAYYEDTDLAMKVRQAGKRVVYQPLSAVVHYEGISSGTDTSTGVKRYQTINQKKFKKQWVEELAHFGEAGDTSPKTVDRHVKGRVLIYDAETPKPDKDSGSVTAFFYMKLLSDLGYRVTFVPQNLEWSGKYSRNLQRIGVEVVSAPYATDAQDYVLQNKDRYDLFILSRATTGGSFFPRLKAVCPDKPIVFDTVDLHHLRLLREAELSGETDVLNDAYRLKKIEMDTVKQADTTLIVSEYEFKYLRDEIGPFPGLIIPLIYEPFVRTNSYSQRADIAFVGGFRHPPNRDAVDHLVQDIWPCFREFELGAHLHIIGSHMPPEFQDYSKTDIHIIGFVEDLEDYLSNIRLTVAPLRYGAGVKGKVGNSLRMGVPVVGTKVAAEGMGLEANEHVLVADNKIDFAKAMADLYSNEALWEKLSNAGQAFVTEAFGVDAAKDKLESLTRALIRPQK